MTRSNGHNDYRMSNQTESTQSDADGNPFVVGQMIGNEETLSTGQSLVAIGVAMSVFATSALVGIGLFALISWFVLQSLGIVVGPDTPLTDLLFVFEVGGLVGGIILCLTVALLLGIRAKRKVEGSLGKVAAADRRRIRMGDQAAELKQSLDARKD